MILNNLILKKKYLKELKNKIKAYNYTNIIFFD